MKGVHLLNHLLKVAILKSPHNNFIEVTPLITSADEKRIEQLAKDLYNLTDNQIAWVSSVINQFKKPVDFRLWEGSDIVNERFLKSFGDGLLIHHCFSKESFTKDKFEYLMEKTSIDRGYSASLAPKGNPGFDIEINGHKVSLKTQADKNIRAGKLHISKFMELGQGQWGDDPQDLVGLRERFFNHMEGYDRIVVLRALTKHPNWHYELVEIPKSLLLEAEGGKLEMKKESKQYPKPGYCRVMDTDGKLKFELYFDGGTERKLQIKNLNKNYCSVHSEWKFSTDQMFGSE